MAELGQVHSEVDAALRAAEALEAVGHVEDGLAARAGELDLGGVHALRPGSRAAGQRVRHWLGLRRRRRRLRRQRRWRWRRRSWA